MSYHLSGSSNPVTFCSSWGSPFWFFYWACSMCQFLCHTTDQYSAFHAISYVWKKHQTKVYKNSNFFTNIFLHALYSFSLFSCKHLNRYVLPTSSTRLNPWLSVKVFSPCKVPLVPSIQSAHGSGGSRARDPLRFGAIRLFVGIFISLYIVMRFFCPSPSPCTSPSRLIETL